MSINNLKIRDLWHQYAPSPLDSWSLKSINLNLQHGELVGLLGPSGCGKTTLLRLIAGFEKPNKGSIWIDDQLVANSHQLIPPERRGVGMVFQDYALFPHLNAWRNVCFGLRRGQDCKRAIWLLELLGLADFRERYPHELSGGQRQRLALARALAPGTSLVLLDEPFSNLDVDVRQKLRSELSGVLSSCSASAIFVTHDPQEALAICDRVAVMREGSLDQCSSPKELVLQPATSFVGRFVLQRNVLPVNITEDKLITAIGSIARPENLTDCSSTELIFDEHSIYIESIPNGNATVYSREFLGDHWLLRVSIEGHLLRVWHPIEYPIKAGERCSINFRNGVDIMLFPGATHCKLD